MLDKMLAAKNFQSAMQMLRQIEFSIFDFKMHATYNPDTTDNSQHIQQVLNEVRDQYSVIKAPDFNRFQHGFGHIFAGGYAAGYYSYKWAEVLDADAFAYFKENGIFNKEISNKFKDTILSQGGTLDPLDLYIKFRGKKPNPDALLKRAGLMK
jgi:oligopeptidase A